MDKHWTRASDLELLGHCAQGDETSLAELHDRHASLCTQRAWEVLRNPTLAEEAVQDAFLDLWRTAAAFDPERAAVRTWLCVLVHRRAVDIARREARHQLAAGEDAPPLDRGSSTAEELLILQIDRRRVRAAIDRLSPVHQQAIELAYWGGLSQSEIAIECGVPVGTIKSRTFDALTRLAALLAVRDHAGVTRSQSDPAPAS
jgi:RNA polymerase sigma-70 factor (ECF subfamily)